MSEGVSQWGAVRGWVSRGLGGRSGVAFSLMWILVQIGQHKLSSLQKLGC